MPALSQISSKKMHGKEFDTLTGTSVISWSNTVLSLGMKFQEDELRLINPRCK